MIGGDARRLSDVVRDRDAAGGLVHPRQRDEQPRNPVALAVDNGAGTFDGQGDVYVGSSTGTVSGYHLSN